MAEKEPTVRKVFVLPQELVDRINEYRASHGIDSEVDAVRRLLDQALLFRDTGVTILRKLWNRWQSEKDIRVLARDVLATHPLVESITYGSNYVQFKVKDHGRSQFDSDGDCWDIDGLDNYNKVDFRDKKKGKYDLDDDIPF